MGGVKPWHNAPPCPSCSAPCATPIERREKYTGTPPALPPTMYCPACGNSWFEEDISKVCQAWWALGAHEARLLIEEGKKPMSITVTSPAAQPIVTGIVVSEAPSLPPAPIVTSATTAARMTAEQSTSASCGYLNADFAGLTCELPSHEDKRHVGRDAQGRTCTWRSEARDEVPVVEQAIDWSRFVPVEETKNDAECRPGDIVACYLMEDDDEDRASVRRIIGLGEDHESVVLAGDDAWEPSCCETIRHADGRWAIGFNPSGPCRDRCGYAGPEGDCQLGRRGTKPCWRRVVDGEIRHFCTEFCRDRFQASRKDPTQNREAGPASRVSAPRPATSGPTAAGEPRTAGVGPGREGSPAAPVVERPRENVCASCGRARMSLPFVHACIPPTPVSCSDGNGLLGSDAPIAPKGFKIVGRSGPGVVQLPGLWIRRARDVRDGSPTLGEPRQISVGNLGGVWDCGEYDILEPIAEPPEVSDDELSPDMSPDCGEGGVHQPYCRHAGKPTAPVAPAKGTLSASERVRECWRKMVFPGNGLADDVAALEARLATAERERDAHRVALREIATCVDPCGDGTLRSVDVVAAIHAGAEALEKLGQDERERDEAMAKAKEREWFDRVVDEEFDAPGLPGSPSYQQAFDELRPRLKCRIREENPIKLPGDRR